MFECVVPSWGNHLGKIKRYGLVEGGVPMEVAFEVTKAYAILVVGYHCPMVVF